MKSSLFSTSYNVIETLYKSNQTLVCRCHIPPSDKNLIIKESFDALTGLLIQQEYKTLKKINGQGAPKAFALEGQGRQVKLFMEDAGKTLSQMIPEKGLSVDSFLELAGGILSALSHLHRRGIVHGNITARHIVVPYNIKKTKIIDYKLARSFSAQQSPEIAGQTSGGIDFGSDLYGLGIVFYQILTGQPPFRSVDGVKTIHDSAIEEIFPPENLTHSLPIRLKMIIDKLLLQNPKDRYGDLYSVIEAFEESLPGKLSIDKGWKELRRAPSLIFNDNLFGRDYELTKLEDALKKTNADGLNFLLVEGESGIGKTSLVRHFLDKKDKENVHSFYGKIDILMPVSPFGVICHVCEEMTKWLMAREEKKFIAWKKSLLEILGPNISILSELIPSLNCVAIEKTLPPTLLSPEERERVMHLTFEKFIALFPNEKVPLVLFLDDLQWADGATLKLLTHLATSSIIKNTLIIGSCRIEPGMKDHPLHNIMEIMKRSENRLTRLELSPLCSEQIREILHSLLGYDSASATDTIPNIIHEKTAGNPFYTIQFVSFMKEKGLLFFSHKEKRWLWDEKSINKESQTENVTLFLSQRLMTLPVKTQTMLAAASCMSRPFDKVILSTLCNMDDSVINATLKEASGLGLLIKKGETYIFSHDKIREAALLLAGKDEQEKIHLAITRILLKEPAKGPGKPDTATIIELSGHYDAVSIHHLKTDEKLEASRILKDAIIHSRRISDFASALKFARKGISLLDENCWTNNYDMALSLHVIAAESAFRENDTNYMSHCCRIIEEKGRHILDRIESVKIKVPYLLSQRHNNEATNLLLDALRQLGVNLPEKAGKVRIVFEYFKTRIALTGKSKTALKSLPPMVNENKKEALRLMVMLSSVAYFGAPRLLPLIGFKMLTLSLRFGSTPLTPYVYAAYAVILCNFLKAITVGRRFSKLSLEMAQAKGSRSLRAKILAINSVLITHWYEPLSSSLEPLREGGKLGIEEGDLEYTSLCLYGLSFHQFNIGIPLNIAEKEMRRCSSEIKVLRQETYYRANEINRRVPLALMGMSAVDEKNWCDLRDPSLVEIMSNPDRREKIEYLYSDFSISFHLGHYGDCLNYGYILEPHLSESIMTGQIYIPLFHYYRACSAIFLCRGIGGEEEVKLLNIATSNLEWMEKMCSFSDQNYLHKRLLIKAERCRAMGNIDRTAVFFDEAMQRAEKSGFIHEEALIKERAAIFYIDIKQLRVASLHLEDAINLYTQWGATSKINRLKSELTPLFDDISAPPSLHAANLPDPVDVIKSMQSILTEVDSKVFLKKIMSIVIQSSGAQRVFFISDSSGTLTVENFASILDESLSLSELPLSLEKCNCIAKSIIVYVRRTLKPILLEKRCKESVFSGDPHIKNSLPQTILCTPVIQGENFKGMLYLEHTHIDGIFTPQRMEIINIISTQIAIYTEKAALIEGRDRLITELNTRIVDHEKAEEKLRQYQDQLRTLSGRLQSAVEEERTHISREIHDELGHGLTGLKMGLLKLDISTKNKNNELSPILEELNAQADETIHAIQRISGDLRPPALETLGLVAAVEVQAEKISKQTGIRCSIVCIDDEVRLDPKLDITVYRIIQEAFTNIVRHSGATKARVRFRIKSGNLQLVVADNGKGLSLSDINDTNSYGLLGMQERARFAGGSIIFRSIAEQGTVVKAVIPLNKEVTND